MLFVVVDKVATEVVLFKANDRVRGTAPVVLGTAIGDDSVPGTGNRKLSTNRPEDRYMPAGRFVASLDRNLRGEEFL